LIKQSYYNRIALRLSLLHSHVFSRPYNGRAYATVLRPSLVVVVVCRL